MILNACSMFFLCYKYLMSSQNRGTARASVESIRQSYSTETALLSLRNDMLLAADAGHGSAVALRHDRPRPPAWLNYPCGLAGLVLSWFSSYLRGRTQAIAVRSALSHTTNMRGFLPMKPRQAQHREDRLLPLCAQKQDSPTYYSPSHCRPYVHLPMHQSRCRPRFRVINGDSCKESRQVGPPSPAHFGSFRASVVFSTSLLRRPLSTHSCCRELIILPASRTHRQNHCAPPESPERRRPPHTTQGQIHKF